jgi:hypothetical protein
VSSHKRTADYRYSIAQWSGPPTSSSALCAAHCLFQRASELGVLVGGAERTSHCSVGGSADTTRVLETVLGHREIAATVMRWNYHCRSPSNTCAVITAAIASCARKPAPTIHTTSRLGDAWRTCSCCAKARWREPTLPRALDPSSVSKIS